MLINQLVKDYNLEKTGYRLITNAGKDGNQEVPHFHFHLLAGQNLGKDVNIFKSLTLLKFYPKKFFQF